MQQAITESLYTYLINEAWVETGLTYKQQGIKFIRSLHTEQLPDRYDLIYFLEGGIFTSDNVTQGTGCKCYQKFIISLLDYKNIINIK